MAFEDKGLQKKVDKARERNEKKINRSGIFRANDATSRTASRLTKAMAPTADQAILSLINMISQEARKGRYTIITPYKDPFKARILQYFRSHRYITAIATRNATKLMIISWAGGKAYQGANLTPEQRKSNIIIGNYIGNTIYDEIREYLANNKLNFSVDDMSIEFNNPKIPKMIGINLNSTTSSNLAKVTKNLP